MVLIYELVSTKQEMHDNGWNISLQQPGNSFGDHSLIMRSQMLVYVVTSDLRNSMGIYLNLYVIHLCCHINVRCTFRIKYLSIYGGPNLRHGGDPQPQD